MAAIKQEATEYQLKRFLRPDWRRFWKPGHENDPLYKLYESVERKFDSNQARVPKGGPEGGQWTSGEGSSGGSGSSDPGVLSDAAGTRFAGPISPQRRAECDQQYRQDTFICNMMRTRSCWAQAEFRYSQCLIGGYVPPIYH
jgi:hypothetical protein